MSAARRTAVAGDESFGARSSWREFLLRIKHDVFKVVGEGWGMAHHLVSISRDVKHSMMDLFQFHAEYLTEKQKFNST